MSSLCAIALTFGFELSENQTVKITWFVFFMLVMSVRLASVVVVKRALQQDSYNLKKLRALSCVGVIIVGFLWGVYPILIIPTVKDVVELGLIVMVYTGLAGGSATILSAYKKVAVCYVLSLMLPVSTMLLLSEIENTYVIAILSYAFTIVIVFSSVKSANFTFRTAQMRHNNIGLLEELKEKNQEIVQNNSVLEKRVKERTEEILVLSNLDPLTKLSNRGAFSEQLSARIKDAQKSNQGFALLFIDLDGFKTINDVHGHEIGDQVLKKVAARLKQFDDGIDLLCRWGGDEFIATCTMQSDLKLQHLATKIINRLSQAINCDSGIFYVTATVGISCYPEHATNESELISRADIAMYEQKNIVKGESLVFSDDMENSISRTAFIRDGLETAISNDELHLVFQPVMDVKASAVHHIETLIRWEKDGQLIPPLEFIPVAERYGHLYEIGQWVVQQLSNHMTENSSIAKHGVSINAAVAQLISQQFANDIHQVFTIKGISPSQVTIEVTESLITDDTDIMVSNLQTLRSLGFNIAVDNFGTGYSSLSQLQKVGPKTIKIDKSFVDNWGKGGEVIVQAIQTMADQLSIDVILVGIEYVGLMQKAQSVGVRYMQGYYFAKPMRVEELSAWITNNDG